MCSCVSCGLHAHSTVMGIDCKIFSLEGFENMTCFDIAHSKECIGLWKETISAGGSEWRGDKLAKVKSYTVMRTHPIFKRLRVLYNLPLVETRKRR